jgi:hypothetical protein
MDTFVLEAKCHMELKNKQSGKVFGYRVKLSVLNPELYFHINGMVVRPPDDKNPSWRVLTPAIGKTVIVEFNGKESQLWAELKPVCLRAVWDFLEEKNLSSSDVIGDSNEEFTDQLLKQLTDSGY